MLGLLVFFLINQFVSQILCLFKPFSVCTHSYIYRICHKKKTLTHFIFTLLIFDPLEDVVDDATSGGVVEKSLFVVDDETAVK